MTTGRPREAVDVLGERDADDDAYLAELRKAMTDDTPLGPAKTMTTRCSTAVQTPVGRGSDAVADSRFEGVQIAAIRPFDAQRAWHA